MSLDEVFDKGIQPMYTLPLWFQIVGYFILASLIFAISKGVGQFLLDDVLEWDFETTDWSMKSLIKRVSYDLVIFLLVAGMLFLLGWMKIMSLLTP